MKPTGVYLLLAWLTLPFVCDAATNDAPSQRPNVLFILTDDQGWFDLGIHGNKELETPVLDRLASEGVRFNRFYATPVCTPTRAGLMTGRFAQRTGAIDTYMGRDVLSEKEITLPSLLQARGYRTGIFGKWHLGRYMKFHPNERGFDEFFGFWQYGFINRYTDSDELFHNKSPVKTTGYVTDVLTDQALGFLERNKARPFFCYVPFNAPHDPHQLPDRYLDRYVKKGIPLRDAQIYGMISCIDDNVGRLLKKLDDLHLATNTVVLFMTDNGGVSRHFKAGLRANKGTVYEGGIRVPLLVRWPNRFKSGAVVEAMAQYVDLFPTLCEITGATAPTDRTIDGKSLVPLLRGGSGPSPHKYLFHQWSRVRPQANTNWAAQDGRFKLVNGALYDLEADRGEMKNIAGQHPDKVRELRTEFEKWFGDVTRDVDYSRRPRIEVGRPDENPVELDVTWATALGDTRPTYHRYIRDRVENWKQVGDGVRFEIDVTMAGSYEVRFSYGCSPENAGGDFDILCATQKLEGTTKATAGKDVFEDFAIGQMKLPRGPAALEIIARRVRGQELMSLHKVWLRRVDP